MKSGFAHMCLMSRVGGEEKFWINFGFAYITTYE